jgi:Putative DnaT-like ssDNA binding protein
MSLTVEDGTGLSGADAYDSLANAKAYMAAMGYVGSFAALASPLVAADIASGAVVMDVDGGSGVETLLAGDRFQFSGVAGIYTVGSAAQAQGGTILGVEFGPAAPEAIANNTALVFIALTEDQVRRGARTIDTLYEDRLKGVRLTSTQALAWPRLDVVDQDENTVDSASVPARWKQAAFEVARICPADQSMDFPAWLTSVQAGSVAIGGGIAVRTVLSYVEGLIRPYVESSDFRVKRAV